MLSVLLVPVIKDKTGKISSIENYRPGVSNPAPVEPPSYRFQLKHT